MPRSAYVESLRARIGNDYLMLPGVTAVIRREDRFLLVRQRDSGRWSLVGGAVEPGETPIEALAREVREEIGVEPAVAGVIGAYGGPALEATYPNGDRVGYVTVAYDCGLPQTGVARDPSEILEIEWFTRVEVALLDRHAWIDQVLDDAAT